MNNQLGLPLVWFPVPEWNQEVKQTYSMVPQYLTIHNTANRASARAEISYMVGNANWTSYHWAVDDVEAIQAIPHNRNAWHCGDGGGPGNLSSIGIEICYSLDAGDSRYPKSEDNGAKLAALILHELGWGIDRMRKHQDWSGKYCPHRILDNRNWDGFKAKVQGYLNQLKNGATAPQENQRKVEEEDMTMTFIRIEEDLSPRVKKGNIYLVNAGARTYKHLNGDQYNAAKAAYPHALMLKATKAVNYLAALTSSLGANEI